MFRVRTLGYTVNKNALYFSTPLPFKKNFQKKINNNTKIDEIFMLIFQCYSKSKTVTKCRVYEFTAEEGSVFLLDWMMKNLQLQQGEIVSLKSVSLENGTYVKLQPHFVEFLEI